MLPIIIRVFLLLVFAALSLFLSLDILLWLGVPSLANLSARLAVLVLLSAFALLLMTGLAALAKAILTSLKQYFSAGRRMQRQLWFTHSQQERLQKLFHFKTLKLRYVHDLKRKQLLTADDRRQVRALSKAIQKELSALKTRLPAPIFTQLQQECKRHQKQHDVTALLELQQKIAGFTDLGSAQKYR
ncbi:MAG: hypothetical protein ABL925_10910 [Methylococcales bacterium]